MKKIISAVFCCLLLASTTSQAIAAQQISKGKITLKTVGASALSLIIWPGIGQAVNNDKGDKVLTHVVIGLLPPFRFWSAYDALVDRKGGYWEGKI